jgi:hypothetical protein
MKKILFLFLLYANTALAQTAVSLDKQNILYIGVNNPLTIAAFDTPDDSLGVRGKGAAISITKNGKGHYIARVSAPGEAKIFVKNNKTNTEDSLIFRVKRIPDPILVLDDNISSGSITLARFRALNSVSLLQHLDFGASYSIQGFLMTLAKENGEPIGTQVTGSIFDTSAKSIQAQAETGDTIYFDDIKVLCPGDLATRKIHSMVWKIR